MMTSTGTTTRTMSTAIALSRRKGKHASSTQNRRMVWEGVVWPLILQVNRSYFTLDEYHAKRDKFCATYNIPQPRVAGGFVSLLVKGILTREKKNLFHSLSAYSLYAKEGKFRIWSCNEGNKFEAVKTNTCPLWFIL